MAFAGPLVGGKRRASRLSKQSPGMQLPDHHDATNKAAETLASFAPLRYKGGAKRDDGYPTSVARRSFKKAILKPQPELDTSRLLRPIFALFVRFWFYEQQDHSPSDLPGRAEIIDAIFRAFCIAFRKHTGYTEAGAGGAGPAEQNQASSGTPSDTAARPKRGGNKRERADDGDGGDGDGEKRKTRLSRSSTNRARRPFACPYFKFDSVRFWKCHQPFRSAADVRQHLGRSAHPAAPLHCPTCYLEFEDGSSSSPEEACEAHIRDQACQPSSVTPRWLTPAQLGRITASSRTGVTAEQNWNAIWDIIFPDGKPRPSPYLSDNPLGDIFYTALSRFFSTGDALELITQFLSSTEQEQMRMVYDRILQPRPGSAGPSAPGESIPTPRPPMQIPNAAVDSENLTPLVLPDGEYVFHPTSSSETFNGDTYQNTPSFMQCWLDYWSDPNNQPPFDG